MISDRQIIHIQCNCRVSFEPYPRRQCQLFPGLCMYIILYIIILYIQRLYALVATPRVQIFTPIYQTQRKWHRKEIMAPIPSFVYLDRGRKVIDGGPKWNRTLSSVFHNVSKILMAFYAFGDFLHYGESRKSERTPRNMARFIFFASEMDAFIWTSHLSQSVLSFDAAFIGSGLRRARINVFQSIFLHILVHFVVIDIACNFIRKF